MQRYAMPSRNRLHSLAILSLALTLPAACGAMPSDVGSDLGGSGDVDLRAELSEEEAAYYAELADQIQQIVPKDGIPAVDEPEFWTATEADENYAPDELVIGLDYGGEQRAYSIPYLSGREIVNDELGGRPLSVTW